MRGHKMAPENLNKKLYFVKRRLLFVFSWKLLKSTFESSKIISSFFQGQFVIRGKSLVKNGLINPNNEENFC